MKGNHNLTQNAPLILGGVSDPQMKGNHNSIPIITLDNRGVSVGTVDGITRNVTWVDVV